MNRPPARRGARRLAREAALAGIYEWLLAGNDVTHILTNLRDEERSAGADQSMLRQLLEGVIDGVDELRATFAPHAAREPDSLSPIEHAVLLLATYELKHHPEVPYRVIINEAIEMAKDYGGAEGHRFVNGVLDRTAAHLRAAEISARSGSRER